LFLVPLEINGYPMEALVDNGASHCYIST